MRVAILLCGQMRRFQDADVLHSLHAFFRLFDTCDIFVSTWSDRGVSHNHGDTRLRGDEGDVITEAQLKAAYGHWLRGAAIHGLKEWERGLGLMEGCRKSVYTEGFEWNGAHIKGTVVPQLFTLWDANKMRTAFCAQTGLTHDLVIRCRPDVIFGHIGRSLYESAVGAGGCIYTINNRATGTYYPQRIYDIFFFGSAGSMDAVCGAWEHLDRLVVHPWRNGLHPRDACRCLYVQARFQHGLQVVDIPIDVCVVKR